MTTRTLAPQNISLIVVDDSAVSVAAPGQLKIDISGIGKQSLALGDGTGSPAISLVKSDGGTGKLSIKVGAVERARLGLTTGEALELVQNDSDGAEVGKLSFSATTGALTSTKGLTISTGGLTVTAGGLTVTAGTVSIALSNYADDAAAAAGGVPVGGWYRTAGAPKIRLV